VGDLLSSSAFVPSKGIRSLGTFVTLCGGQACRPGARRDGTGSGCGGANTAKHFGQTIGSLLRSKNFVLQLLQRRFVPSSSFVTVENSAAVRRLPMGTLQQSVSHGGFFVPYARYDFLVFCSHQRIPKSA
jgi:hypothetical protein